VENQDKVIQLTKEAAGTTRVFIFGMGSSVSHDLVDKLAAAAYGEAEYVQPGERLQGKVMKNLSKALKPSLSDIKIDWGNLSDKITFQSPSIFPALFSGSRLLVYAFVIRENTAPTESIVKLNCKISNSPSTTVIKINWQKDILQPNHAFTNLNLFEVLAAKRRIIDLEENRLLQPNKKSNNDLIDLSDLDPLVIESSIDTNKKEIVDLSVKYQIVSKFTAFMASDERNEATSGSLVTKKFDSNLNISHTNYVHCGIESFAVKNDLPPILCLHPFDYRMQSAAAVNNMPSFDLLDYHSSSSSASQPQLKPQLNIKDAKNPLNNILRQSPSSTSEIFDSLCSPTSPSYKPTSHSYTSQISLVNSTPGVYIPTSLSYSPVSPSYIPTSSNQLPSLDDLFSIVSTPSNQNTSADMKQSSIPGFGSFDSFTNISSVSTMDQLIKLQCANGSYSLDNKLAALLQQNVDILINTANNSKTLNTIIKKDKSTIWATAIAIAVFQYVFVSMKDDWELVVQKSKQFIKKFAVNVDTIVNEAKETLKTLNIKV